MTTGSLVALSLTPSALGCSTASRAPGSTSSLPPPNLPISDFGRPAAAEQHAQSHNGHRPAPFQGPAAAA
jgi:hypothetical protein